MNTTLVHIPFFPIVLVSGLAGLFVALVKWSGVHSWTHTPRVKSKQMLTGNETEFLTRLRKALPQYEVLPQVAMGALLDVNLPEAHPDYWAIRRAFAQKIVDYVVCRPKSLEVVAVIELDDRTHDIKRDKDQARDQMLASAGLRTLRWDSRAKPSQHEIATAVAALG